MPLRSLSSGAQPALQRPSQQYRVGHVPLVILAACKGFQLAGDHSAIVSCDPSVLRKAYLMLKRDDVAHRHDAFAYQYAAEVCLL
jgi:1,4-dihydroxy-2-naphthoyl-CoA synthase